MNYRNISDDDSLKNNGNKNNKYEHCPCQSVDHRFPALTGKCWTKNRKETKRK